MKERVPSMAANSARAILRQATVIYEATGKKITDPRLPTACRVLGESLPWEPKRTRVRVGEPPKPVQPKTPEEIREREEALRRLRYGGYRASRY